MIDDFDIPEWINSGSLNKCNAMLSVTERVGIENAAFFAHNGREKRAEYWRNEAGYTN